MKCAVLLSGGVDSSVALRLAQEAGYDLTAFYLKIWLEDKFSFLGNCPWEEDLTYARAVASAAGVPLRVVNLQAAYWQRVVSYTLREVRAGRTPNPDVLCNQAVKFGAFVDEVGDQFDKVITGHYARVEEKNGLFYLKTTPDPIKDQTYFLSFLSQAQLARACFPLAQLTKQEVRKKAQQYLLPNRNRPDSQGICFLGKIKFRDFLRAELGEQRGDLVEFETGQTVGEHDGYWFFTRGQRQGIKLSGGPWFVVDKDLEKNIVYISRAYREDNLPRNEFFVGGFNWITKAPEKSALRVKVRHGPHFYNCNLQLTGDHGIVKINGQDQGLSPGQFAVFYDDDVCLGGGVIR